MSVSFKKIVTKSVVDVAQSVGGLYVHGDVVSATITAAVKVGTDNLLRITVTAAAAMHLAFGTSSIGAVTGATTPAIRLPNSAVEQVYYVWSTGEYIRADVVATRIEVIKV